MQREAESRTTSQKAGEVRIAEEVVAVIAGKAASEIEGVSTISGGIVGGITEMLGKKNLTRGIKVEVGERQTTIDIHLVVDYGVCIPEVAQRVQEAVKQAVESMTGLDPVGINIHVQGVAFGPADGRGEGAGREDRPEGETEG